MKLTIWQNVDFETPGAICDWANAKNIELNIIKAYIGETLVVDDALIILGGPMSVYDNIDFVENEKSFLKQELVKNNFYVYGICLGAQIIASALGANVFSSGTREIGWRCVDFIAHPLTQNLAKSQEVFHWHGDTFELPQQAIRLASNDAFLNQAFCAFNGRVIATQFHYEVTSDTLGALFFADKEYINCNSKFINPNIFCNDMVQKANNELFKMLDNWLCGF